MKKLLFIVTFLFLTSTSLFAQTEVTTSTSANSSCYDSLVALFQSKGVTSITDGINKVIITIRKDDSCFSIEGKTTIIKNKFTIPVLVKNEKGEWVPIKTTGRTLDTIYDKTTMPVEFSIINGRSPTYITNLGELGDIFFVDLLKK